MGCVPVHPRPTPWRFPAADTADRHGVVAVGADLEPDTLLRAYRKGLFPMPDHNLGTIAWWSWLLLHIYTLIGFRNRLTVMTQWAYSYWTHQRSVRLIVDKS